MFYLLFKFNYAFKKIKKKSFFKFSLNILAFLKKNAYILTFKAIKAIFIILKKLYFNIINKYKFSFFINKLNISYF